MKKVGLLFFALASCCAGAFAGDAYYLIKDGKFQNGVTFTPFEDEKKADNEIAEGDGYATITHRGGLDTRLTGMQGLFIGTKSLVIEYQVDAADIFATENMDKTCEKVDKPTIVVECLDEENSTWVNELVKKGEEDVDARRTHLISKISIDAKSEGFDTKWVEFKRYSYPCKNTEIKTVLIAYKREVSAETQTQLKIKNLYFETEEDKFPIYGCQFLADNHWGEHQKLSSLLKEEGKAAMLFQDGIRLRWDESNVDLNNFDAEYFMSYEGALSDGSNQYVADLNTSFLMLAPAATSGAEFDEPNHYTITLDPITLPAGAIEAGKIRFDAVAKQYGKDVTYKLVGNIDGKPNPDELLPIYVKFDNAEEAVPAFKDSIVYGIWTEEIGEVEIPTGAKSFVVEFRQSEKVSYLVDFFLISYKGKVGVATIDGENKTLSVYPNPVSEAIAFAGIEDIQSVEIVSLNGEVKACSVVNNQVNVSDLAAGEYVIIVNKNITGKFIKK